MQAKITKSLLWLTQKLKFYAVGRFLANDCVKDIENEKDFA